MTISEKLDEYIVRAAMAGAREEAKYDGRDFDALGYVDKHCYLDRFSMGCASYLDELRQAGFEMIYKGD